jgi:uracil-DNA glycosylase
MSEELCAELARLAAAVRAQIEVEIELGNDGLQMPATRIALPRSARAEAPALSTDRVALAPPAPPPPRSDPGLVDPRSLLARARTSEHRAEQLEQLAAAAASCTACALHRNRQRSVFARGSIDAELVLVGEGPGQEEDLRGLPFVGPAGQLLDRMIDAMGFEREEVYICNIVKCRPPNNRTPQPDEAIACARFLTPQLELVSPKVIVALGRCATEHLGVAPAAGPWRGRWNSYRDIPVMPTYHPAFLLRSPEYKRVVWEDLQEVLTRMGRKPRPRS